MSESKDRDVGSGGRKIRVLLVEDSLTIRRRFAEVLGADADLEVVAETDNGKRAIELCRQLRPDVISLDMMLPVMSGLAATEYIMAHHPTPILIVSSSINRGELLHTYDALAAGAVDVLEKPRADEPEDAWGPRLCAALKLVSRIKVISHPRGRLGHFGRPGATLRAPEPAPAHGRVRVVVLGASTGGPGALVAILRSFPVQFSIPVVIVLHIDEPFGLALAEWFEGQTQRAVACPADGALIESFAGRVAMAPPGRHLTVSGRRFVLTADPPVHSCRPSIDVLFRSVAREFREGTVACLLTGMGCDGAAGLLDIRRAGGITIAQDEETSVVYGMPREAALLGAAERILPLPAIGEYLGRVLSAGEGGTSP